MTLVSFIPLPELDEQVKLGSLCWSLLPTYRLKRQLVTNSLGAFEPEHAKDPTAHNPLYFTINL